MNFLQKWLNWKVVGVFSFLVITFLFAGWIWYRIDVNERRVVLEEAVGKYGGRVSYDTDGSEIEEWLIKLKIAKHNASYSHGGVEIFGKSFDLQSLLAYPVAVEISGSPAIDDEDLQTITNFGTIRSLKIPVSTFGDPQAEILGNCTNLEYLDLTGVSLSDEGFSHFGSLNRLRGLTFSNSVLSDESCAVLLKMKRLTHLEIRRTSFTSDGLQLLAKKHRSLRKIIISEGVLQKGDVEKLAKINPNLDIVFTPDGDPFNSFSLEAVIFHSQK